jgi:hypothetical protein
MAEPRTKQRQKRHITGDSGVDIVKRKLPRSWVIREINPDYGLDLHVEVFGPDPEDPESANTVGEHFYIQVKTTDQIVLHDHVVRSRLNVAKYDPDPDDGTPLTIKVAKFNLDTETLLTVETMGAAIPVVLCCVDLSTEDVYYVCLNDYLAKVLLPANPSYEEQGKVTVYIPSWNFLDPDDPSFSYIGLLARRGKFYSAFNTFAYQFNELMNAFPTPFEEPPADDSNLATPSSKLLAMARAFLRTGLRLAIWDPVDEAYWAPLQDVQRDFIRLQASLPQLGQTITVAHLAEYMRTLHVGFSRAANLGRMYEELVREWRQPTYLAVGLDYNEAHAVNPPEWSE